MTFRYGNPGVRNWARRAGRVQSDVNYEAASYGGIAKKTVFMLLLTILIALAVEVGLWMTVFNPELYQTAVSDDVIERLIFILGIGLGIAGVAMLVIAIVIAVKPSFAKVGGPLYAALQGVFLGFIAGFLNMLMPGVSLAALLGTAIVFGTCLFMYRVLGVRIKSSFVRVMLIMFASFLLLEIIMIPLILLLQLETVVLWVQAITAFVCIIFATVTLFWDIQNIDFAVSAGIDKKFEWVLSYSLVTSLIYLYIEILELLVRFFALFASKKK